MLVSLDGDFHGHWLVAPTARVDDLSDEIRRQNNWLIKQFNKTELTKVFNKTLQDLTKSVRKIYVRGNEK